MPTGAKDKQIMESAEPTRTAMMNELRAELERTMNVIMAAERAGREQLLTALVAVHEDLKSITSANRRDHDGMMSRVGHLEKRVDKIEKRLKGAN